MLPIAGTNGNDVLVGTDGDDNLQGLGGDDQLTGGKGADVLDGGTGIDTVRFDFATQTVGANLAGGGFLGEADGDSCTRIENAIGSAFNDLIFGDGNANTIDAFKGNDLVFANGGDDTVFAGDSNDIVAAGVGADHLA